MTERARVVPGRTRIVPVPARTADSGYTMATSRDQPLERVIRTVKRKVTVNLIRCFVRVHERSCARGACGARAMRHVCARVCAGVRTVRRAAAYARGGISPSARPRAPRCRRPHMHTASKCCLLSRGKPTRCSYAMTCTRGKSVVNSKFNSWLNLSCESY